MSDEKMSTPERLLHDCIMDPCAAKNEREWWAHHELTKLRAELDAANKHVEIVRSNLSALEDEKNTYMDYVGDALGQSEDESLWDAAQRVLSDRDKYRVDAEYLREEIAKLGEILLELSARPTHSHTPDCYAHGCTNTAERDAALREAEEQARLLGMGSEREARLIAERDELKAARIAYASEFAPDEEGYPDVGNIHANIRALKAERDALQQQVEALTKAASAVVARWDTPTWKEADATAVSIGALRAALTGKEAG